MNTPIINPIWIYAMDVATSFEIITWLFAVLLGICAVAFLIFYGMWYYDRFLEGYHTPNEDDKNANKTFRKWFKVGTITFIVLVFVNWVIPSQKTIYAMIGATYVTEENINIAGETVTDAIDYIFEKVDMLLEEEEE